jgi:hypothetical protein
MRLDHATTNRLRFGPQRNQVDVGERLKRASIPSVPDREESGIGGQVHARAQSEQVWIREAKRVLSIGDFAARCIRWRPLRSAPDPVGSRCDTRAGAGSAGVVIAPRRISRFVFQRFLDDQPRRQSHELRTLILHLAAGRPSAPSASRVSAWMQISSPSGCSFAEAGRPNRASLVRLIRRGCTPTLSSKFRTSPCEV